MGGDNEGKMKADGMPDMSEREKSAPPIWLAFLFVPLVIGFAIALGVYNYTGKDKYDKNMQAVLTNDGGWAFLSVVVLGRLVGFANLYPMSHKGKVMRGKSGNLRANMFVYKLIGDKAPANKVVMEDEGDLGAFNRANRSLHHMVENFGSVVASIGLLSGVFPRPTFALVCLFAVGRVLHQVGYTTGYGSHGLGFVLSNMLAASTMEGLCLIVGLKGAGLL
jgi:hypothetical protein